MILVLVCLIALLASAMAMFTARPRRYLLLGLTTLMALATVAIYASSAPFRVLAPVVTFLWMSALMFPGAVPETPWGPSDSRAGLALALLLTALLVAPIPLVPSAALTTADQAGPASLRVHGPSDNLQATLSSLTQAGAGANPAYTTLLHDYTTYHAVLVVEGGMFALLLIGLSIYVWRRFKLTREAEGRRWTFERKTYFSFGMASAGFALFLLLIVAANLSNVADPHAGFAQALPDLGMPPAGSQKAALHQSVIEWVQADSSPIPSVLQNGVHDRLVWQLPKAIVSSILLVAFAVFTACVWQNLILDSRTRQARRSRKEKAHITMGVLAVPVTLVLMIMALANTQASFAPITLTLLFS
jgi:hypothetical protein